MIFDGDPISVGDRLFDTRRDTAVHILKLYSDRVLAKIPGQGSVTYSYGGVERGRTSKSLYWHDPRVIIPRKAAAEWAIQRDTLRGLCQQMSHFMEMAHFEEPDEIDPDEVRSLEESFVDVELLRGMARSAGR